MDFSALGGCHQPIHQVPRRSSESSEHSSKVKFSGFFIAPAGARLFCLGVLALILTLPWNPPSAYARDFSNDGIPAPPIVMGLDAPSTSPPALPSDGTLVAPPKVSPSSSRELISPSSPSRSPPPISMANSPSPSIEAIPSTTMTSRANLGLIIGIVVSISCLGIFLLAFVFCWHTYKVPRHPFTPLCIFISHTGASNGSNKNFLTRLNERMKSLLKSRLKIFSNREDTEYGESFVELARFDIGIVVVTEDYFERKGSMIELIAFAEAQINDPGKSIHILPLFYRLTPEELKANLRHRIWEGSWEEMAKGTHPIEVEKCRKAVQWLCTVSGIVYNSQRCNDDKLYIETICKEIDKISRKILSNERNFASNLYWAKTTMEEKGTTMTCIDIEKRRRANQRAGKQIGVMIYINKLLRLLFAFSGLLIIFLSVILDNSFNDKFVRFTAFVVFAPIMIFLGFLASGWFPQIPLRFIAFVKQCGFLQQVVPCSPWHDNVVTNYCGEVCPLKSFEQEEETRLLDFPMSVQNFLYGDRNSSQGTTTTSTTQSTFDSEIQDFQVETSMQELTIGREMSIFPSKLNRVLKCSHSKITTSQATTPKLQEVSSQVEDIVVDIDCSSIFHILDDERSPIFELNGPKINGFPLKVQAFKNTSMKDHSFDLSCTFRNKRTKRMYLTIERLQNLIQNMYQWVENPHPIVVDESSGILHCMAIEDILWEFTKAIYTFKPVHVEHRFLAGFGQIKFFFILSFVFVSFVLSLIPLISDKKSYFFLFFLFVLAPYLFASRDTNPLTFYRFKSLFCPICIKIFGFNRLYKSKSSFRWCNEFRKKRIVNPTHFWIDEEYANTCPDAASCLDVCGFLELPDSPPKNHKFNVICQGWPIGVPNRSTKQHDYILRVKFDSVNLIEDVNFYINVTLAFLDGDYLLGEKNYNAIEVRRVHFVEQLFHCFSNPSFGGYVEKICPRGYCSTTFVAHCPRFIDICHKILKSKSIPKLLVASRMPGSKVIVGVPFWSSEL